MIGEIHNNNSMTAFICNKEKTICSDIEFTPEVRRKLTIEEQSDMYKWVCNKDKTVCLDIHLTPKLIEEGLLNEFSRYLADLRKKMGFVYNQKITVDIVLSCK